MWLFIMFDLPVVTKKQRKAATRFRNNLLKNGFVMMQYSIYIKHCPSYENVCTYIRKVENFLEDEGQVTALMITDKQYAGMQVFYGAEKSLKKPKMSMQLELF